jgi:formylglycine-generating enzyme required for sulfatase activity
MGSDSGYANEAPAHERRTSGFWIDRTEITNAMFTAFVDDTGYVTSAEKSIDVTTDSGVQVSVPPGSLVFFGNTEQSVRKTGNFWRFVEGASWKSPEGGKSNIHKRLNHPVVHISYDDAVAYAKWAGRRLPSESEWERAATYRGGGLVQTTGDRHEYANTWQGYFPYQNKQLDGYDGTAPVGCFKPNQAGVYDMIGNVWEWVNDDYAENHKGVDSSLTTTARNRLRSGQEKVIKGGSHLCSENFCRRFRAVARLPMYRNDAASHLGFRTVRD